MEHTNWQIEKSTLECTKHILHNEVDCDVSFKVGEDEEVIKAHKLILRIRSPVFDKMFNGLFCEAQTDPVIPVTPAAFRTLLRYCYYDCLDMDGDEALSVLYAAIKYMLPILERAARKTLIEKLHSSNIWDVCKYSATVGDKELNTGCLTYLKENLSPFNILDVIKYARSVYDKELYTYCSKHFQKNLSESNILNILKYLASIRDEGLHLKCQQNIDQYLCGTNIWEIYSFALSEGETKVLQSCREYFEVEVEGVKEALQAKDFPNIQQNILLDVLHINDKADEPVNVGFTPGIRISEVELFKACTTWAEAECARQKIEPTGINKRTVLGECLSLIRFPTMLPKDLYTIVYPTGILTQAGIMNLGQYLHRDPGSQCQVDFPARRREFVIQPSSHESVPGHISTVYIESNVRVMLSRVWVWWPGSYKLTVMDESTQRSWNMVHDTKHENYVTLTNNVYKMIHYIDIQPPQVLEAGTRYTVSAERTKEGTVIATQPGEEYISMKNIIRHDQAINITRNLKTNSIIHSLTVSLV